MKQRLFIMTVMAAASCAAAAADRSIVLSPANTSSWETPTHTNVSQQRPRLAVGFWQRSSGAARGVGSNNITAMEYQLPEAAPARVRSASFQFSGQAWQCSGAEPVVIDVYAYAGNGRAEVGDSQAGSRVAQLSADCTSRPAFAQPIDVTAIVRQLSVASGVRHVGFNIRKGNNRQGPGLFSLSAGKLTVVLADQAVVSPAAAKVPRAAPAPGARPVAAAEPKLSKKELQRKERREFVQSER